MHITKISDLTFMKTNDVHAHKGHWWITVPEGTPNSVRSNSGEYKLLKDLTTDVFEVANGALTSDQNKVEKVFVSNLDCMVTDGPDAVRGKAFLKNEEVGNLELLSKSINSNEFLYATGQPGVGNAKILESVIAQGSKKFVGVKLHPAQLGIPANDALFEPYMELAQRKKLPVLFHSQVTSTGDFSHPRRIYELAKKYPDVAVILGHTGAGGEEAHNIAIETIIKSLKNKDAKLFADISWMNFVNDIPSDNPKSIIKLIKELRNENALDRIMFGSDIPVGNFGEKQASIGNYKSTTNPSRMYDDMQNKIKDAIRKDPELKDDADRIIEDIFYNNSENLFFKKQENSSTRIPTPEPKQGIGKKGWILGCIAAVILLLGVYKIIKNKKTSDKDML